MAYNRNTAKTRAVQRVHEARTVIQAPNIHAWGTVPPPYTPRCRHCGSKIITRANRCSTCWRPL